MAIYQSLRNISQELCTFGNKEAAFEIRTSVAELRVFLHAQKFIAWSNKSSGPCGSSRQLVWVVDVMLLDGQQRRNLSQAGELFGIWHVSLVLVQPQPWTICFAYLIGRAAVESKHRLGCVRNQDVSGIYMDVEQAVNK